MGSGGGIRVLIEKLLSWYFSRSKSDIQIVQLNNPAQQIENI